jgi:hypothetical protein
MNYRKVGDKWIINRNGTYLALTDEELNQLEELISDIKSGEKKFYVEDSRRA